MSNCQRCGCNIIGKHWNSKYCTDCAETVHLGQMRHWQYKRKELGTTNFREYRCKDFDEERKEINKEYQRLKLKKSKLYK